MQLPSLTSNDFSGLLNQRFAKNFLPIPSTNQLEFGFFPPDFALPDITNNRTVRLSDYRNKCPVVLDFTRIFTEKQYCPLCYPHLQGLSQRYEEFVSRGAAVLLVTSTDATQSLKVVEDLGLKMPLLSDPDCRIFRAYRVGQALGAPLPAQFVLDRAGKLQFKHLFSFFSPNADIDRLLEIVDEF